MCVIRLHFLHSIHSQYNSKQMLATHAQEIRIADFYCFPQQSITLIYTMSFLLMARLANSQVANYSKTSQFMMNNINNIMQLRKLGIVQESILPVLLISTSINNIINFHCQRSLYFSKFYSFISMCTGKTFIVTSCKLNRIKYSSWIDLKSQQEHKNQLIL